MKINNQTDQIHQMQIANKDPFAGIPKEYVEVAESMEAQFASHLLGEMKKSINQETPDSSAMSYYNSLVDNERAGIMAKGEGSLGLKKVILDQIYPQHLRNKQNTAVKMYKEIDPQSKGVL